MVRIIKSPPTLLALIELDSRVSGHMAGQLFLPVKCFGAVWAVKWLVIRMKLLVSGKVSFMLVQFSAGWTFKFSLMIPNYAFHLRLLFSAIQEILKWVLWEVILYSILFTALINAIIVSAQQKVLFLLQFSLWPKFPIVFEDIPDKVNFWLHSRMIRLQVTWNVLLISPTDGAIHKIVFHPVVWVVLAIF